MISPRTLVRSVLYTILWSAAVVSSEAYSFYTDADHYWDFDLPDNIVDSKTSQQGSVYGDVEARRSLTGTGLRVSEGAKIALEPVFGVGECPVNPTQCTEGFTVSLFIKVIGTKFQVEDYKFLFGNINTSDFEQITGNKGFVVGVKDDHFQIFVISDNYVCKCSKLTARKNIWTYLAFSWKDPGLEGGSLEVYQEGNRVKPSTSGFCESDIENRFVSQNIDLGSQTQELSISAEFDNLAIWFKGYENNYNIFVAPWVSVRDNSQIPIDAYLDVVLMDLPWNKKLSDDRSDEYKNLVDTFNSQVSNLNDSVDGNILDAAVSNFRQLDDANVTARMYFRFLISSWETLLQLQETFENGTLLNSSVEILNCSATDNDFCHVPIINAAGGTSGYLRLYFSHLHISETGNLVGYTAIARELGTFSWKRSSGRPLINPSMYMDIGDLKPFTNYTVRLFPKSSLGYRLGCKPKVYQTKEAGPSAAPNITSLYNTSSTSLFVTWIHNIPPENYNGILIGYRVGWSATRDSGYMDVGREVDSYSITNLKLKFQAYSVYVAGRTGGGVGVKNSQEVMTDEDVPEGGPTQLKVEATSSSSLLVTWREVNIAQRNGIVRGYHVLLTDHKRQENNRSVTLNETILSIEFYDLLPYYAYDVAVTAFNRKGISPASTFNALTGERAPVNPPNASAQSISATSISVQWSFNSSVRNVLGILRGFKVHYVKQNGEDNASVTVGANESSLMLANMVPFTTYNITVGAFTLAGETIGNAVVVDTPQDAPAAPPDNVLAYNTSSTAIKVLWGSIPAALQNGIILGYHLIVMLNSSIERNLIASSNASEMVVTGLKKYTTYQVSLSGVTVIGSGVQSTPINVTTDQDVPSLPPNVTAVMLNSTSIQVNLLPLPSEFVHGILTEYLLTYRRVDNPLSPAVAQSLQVDQLVVNLTDLNEFTNYSVQASAATSKGQGPASAPLYVKTDEDVPASPPLNVTNINSSFSQIQLGWQPIPPDDVNGILLGYIIQYRLTGAAQWTQQNESPFVLETNITYLSQYTGYEIQMLGYTSKGHGPVSPTLNITTADLGECQAGNDNCHLYAECTNTLGSFTCTCSAGFGGNGVNCSDIDECASSPYPCPYGETCINGEGSFFCLNTTNDKDNSSCVFGSNATILNIDKNVDTSTKLTKQERYLFMTEVDTNCGTLSFEWKVSNVTSPPFSVGKAHSITVGLDSEWSNITFLNLGIYLVEYIVRFQDFYFLDYGFIKVLPSPPVAHIAGGPEVSRKHNSIISMDASPSRDVDLAPGNYDGMTFAWSCKRKDEQFYDDLKTFNQSQSSSSRGCFGNEKQTLEDTGRIVFLNTSTMEVNQYYDIKLTVATKSGINNSFVQRVLVVIGDPLYVEINCVVNCGSEVIPAVKTILVSNCSNPPCFKESAELSYRWSLFLQTNPLNVSWSVQQLQNMAGTALITPDLVISPHALVPDRNYRLTVDLENVNADNSNGFAVWLFKTSTVPTGGTCTGNTSSGVGVKTTFTLDCTNWDDPNTPLLYEFILPLADGLTAILSYGYATAVKLILPPGDPLRNYTLTIEVVITSSIGSKADTSTNIQVLPWPLMSTLNASDEIFRLLESPFATFIGRGDLKQATQLVIAVLKSLEQQESGIISKEERIEIKSFIITMLNKVEVRDLRKLIQISSIISLAMDDPTEVKPKILQMVMKMLQDLTNLLADISANGIATDVPYLLIAEKNLVYAVGKQLQASSTGEGGEGESDNVNIAACLEILRKVLRTVAKGKVVGEEPSIISTEALDALVVRLHPGELGGSLLTLETGSVRLPADMRGLLTGAGDFVDVEVISSSVNYYNWDSSADLITSRVLTIDLMGESGEVLTVQNLTTDIQLGIQVDEKSANNDSNTTETLYVKPERSQYHKLQVIREGTSYLVTITAKDSLHVLVKYGSKPSVEDHDKNYTVPDFTSCTKNVTATDEEDEYNCTRNPHQLLLTNEVIKKPGVYYLGILYSRNSSSGSHSHRKRRSCFSTNRQKRSCVETKDPPPALGVYEDGTIPSYDPRVDLNYTIETDELGCRFWSHDNEKWLTEGCKVGPESTKHRLLCLCNHLTSFGGGLLIAPNPIDMDKVFKELSRLDETGNFGVLLTIIFVFLLYVIAIVLAKRADRRDQAKLGPRIVLETEGDLLPNEYELTISTGVWADSGTTAKVTMVFYGSSGNSGPITVHWDLDPNRVLLSRGGIDKYIISLSTPLGTLNHAYVWHDNSGESPSWFLDYIAVREKETSKEWKLICNQWFSPEKDDGKIIRRLLVERTNSLPEFQDAFRSTLSGALYESHLWMSSVTKRPASSFTRAQRVTCCLCVVFTAMLANAMFFNLGGESTESTLKIGPLKVSLRQIIITIQSCLIIAPINFLIVAIFKHSRPTFDRYCCKRSREAQEQDPAETEGEDQPLHHIFVYVAWFLCFATAITSATVVFFYSLMWGKETADEWLSSILMSITMDILAIQPVRLVILAAVAAIVITKAKRTKAKLSTKNRSTAWEEEEENEEMPEFFNRALPDPLQLEWYKKHRENEAKTMSAFKSLTFFVSFLLILGMVSYGNRDYHQYLIGKEVKAIFPRVAEVKDASGFWIWMTNIFAPAVYATNWYNGAEETNKVHISDKSSVLIGMPRIRQLRVEKDACPKRIVESYNVTEVCYPHYSKSCEDKTPMYLPKWKYLPSNASRSSFSKLCPKPWRYQSSDEMNNLPKISPRATYGGGGYVADLGYDQQTARRVMADLSENNWIDRRARVAIVEFSIFNINKNILVVANYFFEFLPTGGVFSYVRVEMLELYGTEASFVQLVLLCRLLLIIMIVAYCVIETVKMYYQRGSYFKNVWNWLALVLIVTSVTAVVFHIVREKTTTDTIKEQLKNVYATVSFHKAISLLDIETTFLSLVIFLATIKLLSLLRFSKQIVFLSITIRLAGKYLTSFSFVFVIIFCSFAMCGMVAFGALVESYSSFLRVCVSQFEFLLGKAVPNFQMSKVDPLLAFLFSALYICSMTILFLNVFIVVLNSAMEEVNDNLDVVTHQLDLADFMARYFTKRISNICGRKERKTRRLYCENMTFEDECAYVENCLIEIDRRIAVLAQDALTEGCVLLKRARQRKSSVFQTQAPMLKINTDPTKKEGTRQCNSPPLEEPTSDEEESTSYSSESENAVKNTSNPHSIPLSTMKEMEKTNQMVNRPTSPSEVNVDTDYEDSKL